jgi:hypothetical protein
VRTIRHQPAAADAYDAAFDQWERADEVWNAMEWTLARDPIAGVALTESGHVRSFIIQGARSVGWPTLTVIYTNDNEDQITIHEAIFEEAGTYKAGLA